MCISRYFCHDWILLPKSSYNYILFALSCLVSPMITSFLAYNNSGQCVIMEGELLKLKCTAIGYPAYCQIKTGIAKNDFVIATVNSKSNMTQIGSSKAGKLINANQAILPVGEHELVCEVGFLPWNDSLDTTVQDSSSITCTIVASMVFSACKSTTITVLMFRKPFWLQHKISIYTHMSYGSEPTT